MVAIFHDMIEKTMEVFMDDFSVFGDSFSSCLSHLDKMLQRYEDTNLVLNWEKCHFMVKEGIVLGHRCARGVEVRLTVEIVSIVPMGPHESFQCQLMNQNYFEPNPSYSNFDQPPQYSIDHQEDLNQQKMNDEFKIELWNELLNTMQSLCERILQQEQATNIDQSPPKEMSIQDMDDQTAVFR
ncbi:hypothetical protein Tco_0752168 [Tanacetum coccineum]|uniref:Reverse transcriptase domain-containing protein n=1 Tax=Tanacetum coccineum TaxID=301880 RepID=A0ABQ4Z8U9_9ASTR